MDLCDPFSVIKASLDLEVEDLDSPSENELVVRYAQACGVNSAKIGRLLPGTKNRVPGGQKGIEGFLNETPISVKDLPSKSFQNIADTLATNNHKIGGTDYQGAVIVVRTRSLTQAQWLDDDDAAAIATNTKILDGAIVRKLAVLTSDGQWMWATQQYPDWKDNNGCGPL